MTRPFEQSWGRQSRNASGRARRKVSTSTRRSTTRSRCPNAPHPLVTLQDLDRVIGSYDLMPPGTEVRRLGDRQYAVRQPGMTEEVRVTTDPEFYDEHADDAELWSPGNPLFAGPEPAPNSEEAVRHATLQAILDGSREETG